MTESHHLRTDRPYYRLPAEWESQQSIMLAWPHACTDWAPQLHEAEKVYSEIVKQISAYQNVVLLVQDHDHQQQARNYLTAQGAHSARIHYYPCAYNDTWTRDYGPITVRTSQGLMLIDFIFNGWGGKFDASKDNQATLHLWQHDAFGNASYLEQALVLEGGSLEVDGQGTLLTTRQCLLHPTRNPSLSKTQLETMCYEVLGIDRCLWLQYGHLEGDDTDAHIDTLARFCDPKTIAYMSCEDPRDSHYDALQAMQAELQSFRTLEDHPYQLIPLPLPSPCYGVSGERLPATYANFLITNQQVLVPIYQDPMDAVALERLQAAFPKRQVIGIDCRALIQQHGSLHCITMQIPQSSTQ